MANKRRYSKKRHKKVSISENFFITLYHGKKNSLL